MNIRLHEIEFGTEDVNRSKKFYQCVLGLKLLVDEERLKVFDAGVKGLDFNASTHHPAKKIVFSFITDNIEEVIRKLQQEGVAFNGPNLSHLGMLCIEFNDPEGNLIKVNTPGSSTPSWLKV